MSPTPAEVVHGDRKSLLISLLPIMKNLSVKYLSIVWRRIIVIKPESILTQIILPELQLPVLLSGEQNVYCDRLM